MADYSSLDAPKTSKVYSFSIYIYKAILYYKEYFYHMLEIFILFCFKMCTLNISEPYFFLWIQAACSQKEILTEYTWSGVHRVLRMGSWSEVGDRAFELLYRPDMVMGTKSQKNPFQMCLSEDCAVSGFEIRFHTLPVEGCPVLSAVFVQDRTVSLQHRRPAPSSTVTGTVGVDWVSFEFRRL